MGLGTVIVGFGMAAPAKSDQCVCEEESPPQEKGKHQEVNCSQEPIDLGTLGRKVWWQTKDFRDQTSPPSTPALRESFLSLRKKVTNPARTEPVTPRRVRIATFMPFV